MSTFATMRKLNIHRLFGHPPFQLLAGAALMCLYVWLYLGVFGLDLPKTAVLKKRNAAWQARLDIINRDADLSDAVLDGIEDRDNSVYRSIFGLKPIPSSVMKSGFGGVNRYAYLDEYGADESLKNTTKRLDVLLKRAYIQSLALDEVSTSVKEAGDLVSCIPSIPPIMPVKGTYNLSSPFGYRVDPVYGGGEFHSGQDIAAKVGVPVYAPGAGVVETVDFNYAGYGNEVIVNHGFGYKTRYAHLSTVDVGVGEKLERGDKIGEVGRSGKVTGAHLHYEVLYMDRPINPSPFMDWDVPVAEYRSMVNMRRHQSQSGRERTSAAALTARSKKQGTNVRR